MSRFAETTSVSSDKSRSEIEKTLTRYGASRFLYGWQDDQALVAFTMLDRQVKFILPLPSREDPQFTRTPTGRRTRSVDQQHAAYEQSVRQRWRALALVIKAKLEAVESGITEFEEEFLAHIVLPNGETVGSVMCPQVALAYENGTMPALLPHFTN